VRIIDAAGQELPERHEGRLQFRGPSAARGYHRNPQATRELLDGDWRNSGDLAYVAEGDVVITGRTKDLIIHAGRNVYPQEIEEAVGDIPGVRKGCVAVFAAGRGHHERLVVLAETREPDPAVHARLRADIATLVSGLAGTPPEDIVLAAPHTVPKTSSGKIRRAASRELFERGRLTAGARPLPWQIVRLVLAAAIPELRRLARAGTARLFAGYAWLMFALLGIATFLAVALLPGMSRRWRAMRAGARLVAYATGTRLDCTGLEQLPPPGAACVLAANHMSYLDGITLVAVLPRPVGFVAKAEFRRNPVLRLFLTRIGCEFVERFDREQGVADARRLAQATRAGRALLFFPEGTFTRIPGLLPFRLGAFTAAAEAGVPVVPVAIRGTRDMLRGDTWFPRRGSIHVSVGEAIDPRAAPAGSNRWQTALWLRDTARTWILHHTREPDLAHELGGG
jgi:1-acyl-sn-glycerol-3-phosphate acyltransferase